MCGIVGYTGFNNAQEKIINGLEKLEYRGYDSAGIVILNDSILDISKFSGRLSVLKNHVTIHPKIGNIGIGHTRWATHGAPSDKNAHPHYNKDESIAIVHNGIIENYLELKYELIAKGYTFTSETDTEVIAHLFDIYYQDSLLNTAFIVSKLLKGSYAILVISKKHNDEIIAIRHESPLVIGHSNNEYYLASDICALLEYTNEFTYLDNRQIAKVTPGSIEIYDEDRNILPIIKKKIDWSVSEASKNDFPHFMLKEIFQQPEVINNLINNKKVLNDVNISHEKLKNFNKIYIIGCGTAYYAGCVGKVIFEKLLKRPVITDIASEFRYNDPFIDESSLVIFVTQSGETADTLACMQLANSNKATTLVITNVLGSSATRYCNHVIYTNAGPEIAVASTKAYTTQLTAFYLLALDFALKLGSICDDEYQRIISDLKNIPDKITEILKEADNYKAIVSNIANSDNLFYLGRNLDYYSALESALKLKEISYIHAECFAAGELKHGTIALIEQNTPVIALATQTNLIDKINSNIQEVKARGAYIISICNSNETRLNDISDKVIYLPITNPLLSPLLSIIVTQLIAYHTSNFKGLDVDKPRNLAKSVTVE